MSMLDQLRHAGAVLDLHADIIDAHESGDAQRAATPIRQQAGRHLTSMEEIMRAVCADFETDLVEFNGEPDHVHLLVNFPPKVTVAKLVNSLKGVSSRRLRQEFPDLVQHYWRANKLWSGSYFAGSVGGAPIEVLRRYIEQQARPAQ